MAYGNRKYGALVLAERPGRGAGWELAAEGANLVCFPGDDRWLRWENLFSIRVLPAGAINFLLNAGFSFCWPDNSLQISGLPVSCYPSSHAVTDGENLSKPLLLLYLYHAPSFWSSWFAVLYERSVLPIFPVGTAARGNIQTRKQSLAPKARGAKDPAESV